MADSYDRLKRRAYEILHEPAEGDTISRAFDIFIIGLISLNVGAVMVESIESAHLRYRAFFRGFETFSVIVFTAEYALRLWTVSLRPKYRRPFWGRVRFALTPLALVDLLAILPYYLPFVVRFDLRFLRAVRLVRLFRIFKLGRYTGAINTFVEVLTAKKEDLSLVGFTVLILLIVAASLMYVIEGGSGQAIFSSVPAALWWAAARLTSLGYSDIYPVTLIGKVLAIFIALIGVGLFAVIGGILGSGFVEAMRKGHRDGPDKCPHCGADLRNRRPPDSPIV